MNTFIVMAKNTLIYKWVKMKLLKYYYYCYYFLISDYKYVCRQYVNTFGCAPDLKNPRTFNEKILWKKLYADNDPLYTYCSDKFLVRNYVATKVGAKYLVPLLQAVDKVRDFNFEKLPNSFIFKANHGCGWNKIVFDKSSLSEYDKKNIIFQLKTWVRLNYYIIGREYHYKNIPPKLLAEQLLLDEEGNIPKDYKIFCFNGKVELIAVDIDRLENHRRKVYDASWNALPFEFTYKYYDGDVPRPSNLEEMIKVATKLAEDFAFVRVDLYSLKGKIYFGELTFNPMGGFGKFTPQEYDFFYGEKLLLNNAITHPNGRITKNAGFCGKV